MIKITLESKVNFSRLIRCKNGTFVIDIYWCESSEFWYMNVSDSQRKIFKMSGIKLILGFDLFNGFVKSDTPMGSCYLDTISGLIKDPRFDNIGDYTLNFDEY